MAMLPYSKLKHSSRHILSFGIVLILSFVFNPRALASTECKTLHTAGAQQWFPYAFNEFEGRLKATGIAFDVLTLLARDLGVTLKIETGLPWKRIESKLDAGELDILAGNYWNEARSRKWLITAPFAAEEVYVVLSPSLSQTRGTDLSLNALAQYIGVMPRGISLGEKFDSIKSVALGLYHHLLGSSPNLFFIVVITAFSFSASMSATFSMVGLFCNGESLL